MNPCLMCNGISYNKNCMSPAVLPEAWQAKKNKAKVKLSAELTHQSKENQR